MPSHVPAVRYNEARHSSMRTLLSSAGVSRRTLMGYTSYARNRACALPSPSPFHYVTAKIVPVVQFAAHTKSSTLYGRQYGLKSKFFRLDAILFRIIMGLCCELRYNARKSCPAGFRCSAQMLPMSFVLNDRFEIGPHLLVIIQSKQRVHKQNYPKSFPSTDLNNISVV